MNKVILTGRLTRDPIVNASRTVALYTLATTSKGYTDFIDVATFGNNVDFANLYLKKGMKIAVYGRIQTDSYINVDGQKVRSTKVIAESHEFLEKKKDNNLESNDISDELKAELEATMPFA